ncbi:MAG: sigma 54-interacting transcriptional regulator [Rectinemataceae bacterium]
METILILGGEPAAIRGIATALADVFRIQSCDSCREAADVLRRLRPAAIVAYWQTLENAPPGLTSKLVSPTAEVPLIALIDPHRSAQTLRAAAYGAADTLPTGASIREIRECLDRVLRRRSLPTSSSAPFVGSSPPLLEAAERIRLYSDYDYPVLILGESGTGKELAARALHQYSLRREAPFIGRNCAALPDLLAESELFGTERGAFTDAVRRSGAFELARGGVLFLDEIGDMSASVQAKLLRTLETGEYWPLGAREPLQSDVRFVSATSRDLRAAAEDRGFRADLLYRIDTLILRLPPLRECRDDIPDMASHFVNLATEGKVSISRGAILKLADFNWPGNVRQLKSVMLRAVVHARGASEIGEEHIFF